MYGQGAGTVIFPPHSSMSSCPQGLASPQAAIAAIVITAAAGSPLEDLKQQVDTLLHIYGSLGEELRASFHLFIAVDGHDAGLQDLAAHYVYESLGVVKLVQFAEAGAPASSSSGTGGVASSSSSSSEKGGERTAEIRKRGVLQQQQQQQQRDGAAGGGVTSAGNTTVAAAAGAGGGLSSAGKSSSSPPPYGAHSQADHQRFMLHIVLDCFKYPAVLFLDPDMELSSDFFGYLAATQWLLLSDSSLYCVSAWNEFGRSQLASSAWSLLRTDYHPAKAWIISAAVGQELLGLWRNSSSSRGKIAAAAGGHGGGGARGRQWGRQQRGAGVREGGKKISVAAGGLALDASMEEWMKFIRRPDVRRGRQCILPERPRVVSRGELGPLQTNIEGVTSATGLLGRTDQTHDWMDPKTTIPDHYQTGYIPQDIYIR